ncbi:MAG TPA: hypothetical protein VK206_14185 [Anaerolineales bacterium]|nr:hypothetical protein [Anaerolineales bacterium]
MLEARKYLHNHSLDGRIGAWHPGIIGDYQGGTVINFDGLVNEIFILMPLRIAYPVIWKKEALN